jgi:hypothetical protein
MVKKKIKIEGGKEGRREGGKSFVQTNKKLGIKQPKIL